MTNRCPRLRSTCISSLTLPRHELAWTQVQKRELALRTGKAITMHSLTHARAFASPRHTSNQQRMRRAGDIASSPLRCVDLTLGHALKNAPRISATSSLRSRGMSSGVQTARQSFVTKVIM
ncbi:hypothetical protein BDW22DRAFT_1363703 [Trametopsis cervina]|nr:hypothetical protein BDW22DRAFT_1363703 [Trametopsis cervina]